MYKVICQQYLTGQTEGWKVQFVSFSKAKVAEIFDFRKWEIYIPFQIFKAKAVEIFGSSIPCQVPHLSCFQGQVGWRTWLLYVYIPLVIYLVRFPTHLLPRASGLGNLTTLYITYPWSLNEWLTATFEFGHKEWLLRPFRDLIRVMSGRKDKVAKKLLQNIAKLDLILHQSLR